jgi:peroxiredoxin
MDLEKIPAVGDVAPDFALEDTRGRTRRLSEMAAEQLIVLVFFRGHW